jgi:hypothetical protein
VTPLLAKPIPCFRAFLLPFLSTFSLFSFQAPKIQGMMNAEIWWKITAEMGWELVKAPAQSVL